MASEHYVLPLFAHRPGWGPGREAEDPWPQGWARVSPRQPLQGPRAQPQAHLVTRVRTIRLAELRTFKWRCVDCPLGRCVDVLPPWECVQPSSFLKLVALHAPRHENCLVQNCVSWFAHQTELKPIIIINFLTESLLYTQFPRLLGSGKCQTATAYGIYI